MRRHASGGGSTAGIRYIVFLIAFLLQGCYTLNGTVPFKYVPSLSSGDSIEMRAGMERLADKRPSNDKSSTENIDDVSDKVTAKLLEDFRASQLFTGLDLPPQKGKNDLILRGDIKRFYWKATPSPIAFIPIVNLAAYFGAPVTFIEAVVAIQLEVVSTKSGQVVATYERTATREDSYTIYRRTAGEAGAELAEAFRDVAKQLKESIVADAKAERFSKR